MPDSYLDEFLARKTGQTVTPVLTATNLDESVQKIQSALEATGVPYARVYKSTLGGPDRGSVMITVSLDPKESWGNGILENSRYFHMSLGYEGVLKQFSGMVWTKSAARYGSVIPQDRYISKPFRKTTVKSVDEAIAKITKYLGEVMTTPKTEGWGRMGGLAKGPGGSCVCPKCGRSVTHLTGMPCYARTCPDCGVQLVREAEADPADIYHDTILDFLMDKFGSDRSAQDSANIAMYWFSDDYKSKSGPVSGELQLASLFKLMSGMDYQPDPNVRSIRDVPNDLAKDMYATLEEEFRAGEDGVFGEIRKLLEPVATDDEQYDDIKSAIEDEIESQANAHAAEAWSTPTDDMTDEHGEDIFLLADFGDWIAVNGDLHLGGPVPTPPEGFRSVNVGGRVPTTEEEVSMDSVIDQVAKTLKIDRARVQAVADEEGYGELTHTSVSGEVEAYANPKNKETPEEEALRSAPSRSNIIGREKGLERLQ